MTQHQQPPGPDRDVFGRAPARTSDWSHRRGEPRVFAFGWTLYLMAIVGLMFVRGGALSTFSADSFRPTARITMVLLVVGALVLWPLVRLSQAKPRAGGIASSVRDLVVILVPAQALIWPQTWLADWPLGVVLMLSAMLAVWSMLVGAVVAMGLGPAEGKITIHALQQEGGEVHRRTRSWAIIACLGLTLLGLLAPAFVAPGEGDWLRARPAWMASPFLAVFEITRDRPWLASGAAVGRIHWLWVSAIGLAGATAWLVAFAFSTMRSKGAGPV